MASSKDLTADSGVILVTGGSGYVGGILLKRLAEQDVRLRCMSRNPDQLTSLDEPVEVVHGDVLDPPSLPTAMSGITTAYYLVHSMGYTADFAQADLIAARNFGQAAKQAGVKRIIYLGGLGDEDDADLSPHLRSRHEVGRTLRGSGVETIELRSSAVLGSGSLSFELIRSLTDRLPVMICPRWLATPTQPIASNDLIEYLAEAAHISVDGSRVFEIGGSDVVTYGELIKEYALQRGLRRWLISVPVLTPYLSGLWLGLVTPASAEVGRHLIEGLKNPTIVTDDAARKIFTVKPMGIKPAVQLALECSPSQIVT